MTRLPFVMGVAIGCVLSGIVLLVVELHSPFMPRTVTFLTFVAFLWLIYLVRESLKAK